jgi:hypothetical protein
MEGIIWEQPSLLSRQDDDSLQDRQHKMIITDESAVDTYETVFKVIGCDLSHRMKGKKKVTYGHPSVSDLNPDLIIGIGEERIVGTTIESILTIEPEIVDNSIANTVHQKLNFGSLTDASIRARVIDGRMGDESLGENASVFYFTMWRLYDWGVVPEGSNPNAMKQRSDLADFIKTKVPNRYHSEIQMLRALSVRYHIM